MASQPHSLSTTYSNELRSLNPCLPQVIEHLVNANVLTRTEASRVVSTSDQFPRLCQLLASKGSDRTAEILSEIKDFRKDLQKSTADRHLKRVSPMHHKHMCVLWEHMYRSTYHVITICLITLPIHTIHCIVGRQTYNNQIGNGYGNC